MRSVPQVGKRYLLRESGLRAEVEVVSVAGEVNGLVTFHVVVRDSPRNQGALCPDVGERFELSRRLDGAGALFSLTPLDE